jgi:hypothetical protein
MRYLSTSVIGKVLGTVVLAGGFLLLISQAPFVPESDEPAPRGGATLAAPNVTRVDDDAGAGFPDGFEPPAGLFKAYFAASADSPGFGTQEHSVQGVCEGAGKRWSTENCPACAPLATEARDGFPALLLWTETVDGVNRTRAVTADCTEMGSDGLAVVTSITFDDPLSTAGITEPATRGSLVPLLPGATRTAALEVGEWLATFDRVARPSTALGDMVALLETEGWRDIATGARFDMQTFEGERVLTNDANATCLLTLTKQDGDHQLLTIISPGRRG